MLTNKIKISQEATDKMKQLKSKLRIGPLYSIARMALALSLENQRPPQDDFYKEDGMEFNRLTLLGEYYTIYMCMLNEYGLYKKPTKKTYNKKVSQLSSKEITSYMVAHINRGVIKLHNKVKNQEDLYDLIKEQRI